MMMPIFIIEIIQKGLPLLLLLGFPELIIYDQSKLVLLLLFYVILGFLLRISKCTRCKAMAHHHPDGYYLWAMLPIRCRFCGKSFVHSKFNKNFEPIKAVKSQKLYKMFLYGIFVTTLYVSIIIFIIYKIDVI